MSKSLLTDFVKWTTFATKIWRSKNYAWGCLHRNMTKWSMRIISELFRLVIHVFTYPYSNSRKCSRRRPTCISKSASKSPKVSSSINFSALSRASEILACWIKVAISARVMVDWESYLACNWPSFWLAKRSSAYHLGQNTLIVWSNWIDLSGSRFPLHFLGVLCGWGGGDECRVSAYRSRWQMAADRKIQRAWESLWISSRSEIGYSAALKQGHQPQKFGYEVNSVALNKRFTFCVTIQKNLFKLDIPSSTKILVP